MKICGPFCNNGACSTENGRDFCPGVDWQCEEPWNRCDDGTSNDQLDVCLCDLTVDALPFCWKDNYCSGLQECSSTDECPEGYGCVTTCCDYNTTGAHCFPECDTSISGACCTEQGCQIISDFGDLKNYCEGELGGEYKGDGSTCDDSSCETGQCSDGVSSKDICCDVRCGTCGGTGCSKRGEGFGDVNMNTAEYCCMKTIREERNFCDENDPPCIIVEVTPAPIPVTTDPDCSYGIPHDNVCCASTCKDINGDDQCGGDNCSALPGGSVDCCMTTIRFKGDSCNDGVAPCIINPISNADPDCSEGVRKNNVCCKDTECDGVCGGVGCGLREGGKHSCCTSTILDDNNSCYDQGAPCVIHTA